MNRFASGPKAHYYGKGDVSVYRLNRVGNTQGEIAPVFGANVLMLLYGDAFWQTYTSGDNSSLIATDSMKNFIQRETMNFEGNDLEGFCRFLAERFLRKYPQAEGLQVSAEEIPYEGIGAGPAFMPRGVERAFARVELGQNGWVETVSGLRGFKFLRLGGSAFKGFVRDEYTTLPDLNDRPLHMWLDLEWTYMTPDAAFTHGAVAARFRQIVREVFTSFQSGSIQQLVHQIGTTLLSDTPSTAEVRLEANNRTWDTIAEQGAGLGVYTDARPAFGCIGLTLRR